MCHLEYLWDFEYLREVWRSEKYGNQIFRVKSRIGETSKGVGKRSGSQYQSKVKKYKKARYAIGNISMKDLFNKIKEFEKLSRYLMWKGSPNMNPLQAIFIYLGVSQSVCWDVVRTIITWTTCTTVMKKRWLSHRTLMIRTRTNKKNPLCTNLLTNLHRRIYIWT